MSAISGTRRKAQELSDGTLRVMVDIDPRFKAEFHRLFPTIDMPVAIAPLVADFERREPEATPKGGPLARLAGIWCKDEDFQKWLSTKFPGSTFDESAAADLIRKTCWIESRADLDSDERAAHIFQQKVRRPYMDWVTEQEKENDQR